MGQTVAFETFYRPVGRAEVDLIRASSMTAFPPRLPHQPTFYPGPVERYAAQIAHDAAGGHVGYVTRLRVPRAVLDLSPPREVGDADALDCGGRPRSCRRSTRV